MHGRDGSLPFRRIGFPLFRGALFVSLLCSSAYLSCPVFGNTMRNGASPQRWRTKRDFELATCHMAQLATAPTISPGDMFQAKASPRNLLSPTLDCPVRRRGGTGR